ncbi:hypothetical protein [Micromonospora sp. NPDC004704]
MSLFGYFIVARHVRPLPELPSIERLCRESVDGIRAGTVGGLHSDGDWQFLQVLDGAGLDVADLVAETGAPALSVYVIESAVGVVGGAAPGGDEWYGCLNPADAVRAFDMPSELAGSVEQTTGYAVRWAESAGRTADPVAVAAAVDAGVGPFGEGVKSFVDGLGFRFGFVTAELGRKTS